MEHLLYILLAATAILLVLVVLLLIRQPRNGQQGNFSLLEKEISRLEPLLQNESARNRQEASADARALRQEIAGHMNRVSESLLTRLNENTATQLAQLESFARQLARLTATNEEKLEKMRTVVETRLTMLQQDNSNKLEQMRATVDEKLHATLEKRLGESFRLVSERLELVHKGLGEMQSLASGVGDLKRVLTNVKTRGIWGEIHLGAILEQILTPDQYAVNQATVRDSKERVEYAVKLPGKIRGETIWLPIDAKFPQEDYDRLLESQEQANPVLAEEAARALETRLKNEARSIAEKYISPPDTTDFGILFLPVEGLYAEALRRPGLYETLLREWHIVLAGPTTLAALLNSLQMGFRTLAIEKRSSEVWTLLGAIKTDFTNFGALLDKTHKKLQEASNSIDTAQRKSRTIQRKLKHVEELPAEDALQLLGPQPAETAADDAD